jgi:hypothetical protein
VKESVKELVVIKADICFFFQFLKTMVIYENQFVVFLRIVVISVNHSHNHVWFVLVYDIWPTLVEQPIRMHPGSSHRVPYIHGNHLHSLPT